MILYDQPRERDFNGIYSDKMGNFGSFQIFILKLKENMSFKIFFHSIRRSTMVK